jgi:uncharacterized protein YegP (UPF0339 family)
VEKQSHRGYVKQAENGEWFWETKAENGEPIGKSTETYVDKDYAIEQLKAEHPDLDEYKVIEPFEAG